MSIRFPSAPDQEIPCVCRLLSVCAIRRILPASDFYFFVNWPHFVERRKVSRLCEMLLEVIQGEDTPAHDGCRLLIGLNSQRQLRTRATSLGAHFLPSPFLCI